MKKSIYVLLLLSLGVIACTEDDNAVDYYHNWVERNQQYIDSIAQVAKENPQWLSFHTYKYPASSANASANEFIYVKPIETGSGTTSPLYTDSVEVYYRGRLIPLYDGTEVVFDQNYRGELDLQTAVSTKFSVSGVVTGWTTALMQMHEGDYWTIYIPTELGYDSTKMTDIPAYSTLIFDVYLKKIIPMSSRE
ncbi:MAG: FKBP-type peptidyl-prolyl cis-trans isomerase [Bacteroidales bacterium]|nr:FKBP-type peptidyl-prolyl cis-trans isomerase [Bacteroidales bacterium]